MRDLLTSTAKCVAHLRRAYMCFVQVGSFEGLLAVFSRTCRKTQIRFQVQMMSCCYCGTPQWQIFFFPPLFGCRVAIQNPYLFVRPAQACSLNAQAVGLINLRDSSSVRPQISFPSITKTFLPPKISILRFGILSKELHSLFFSLFFFMGWISRYCVCAWQKRYTLYSTRWYFDTAWLYVCARHLALFPLSTPVNADCLAWLHMKSADVASGRWGGEKWFSG